VVARAARTPPIGRYSATFITRWKPNGTRAPSAATSAKTQITAAAGQLPSVVATQPSPAANSQLTFLVSEAAGSVRFHLTQNLDLFGTFSYDNNDAKLFRTSISLKF